MGSNTAIWVDDRDPRVRFNGVWPIGGSPGDFKETVSSSTRVGDSFVVPFYGRSIVVYGTFDATSGGVVTNYSIDGASPVQVVSQRGTGDTPRQQFWASPVLNITQHELTVTMAKVNPDPEPGEGTIWFDYFIVNDPSGHEGVAPSKRLSKGGIVGVVLGSLGFILVITGCILWWIQRRRRRKEELSHFEDSGENGVRGKELGADARWSHDGWRREGRELGEGDGRSPWFLGRRQGRSRNGVQPFVLGFSTSSTTPRSGETGSNFVPPPVMYRGGDTKRGMSRDTPTAVPDRDTGPRPSQTSSASPSTPTNAERSSTTTITMVDSQESTSSQLPPPATPHTRRQLHSPSTPHSSDGSVGSTGPIARPIKRGHQTAVDDHNLTPQSSSAADEQVTERPILQRPISGAVADVQLGLSDEHNHSSRPIIRIRIADSVDRINASAESNDGLGDRETLQHIDSGIRLGGQSSLPMELPPVYSPT